MVNLRYLFVVLIILQAVKTRAQELPVAQQYLHNLSFINPACTGRNYCTEFFATDRHQWLGISQAPKTQVLGVEHTILPNPYLAARKFGLSLQFISDRNGAVRKTGGQGGYAFHTRLNKKKELFLSLGLNVSLLQHSIREGDSNVGGDPALGSGESALLPDASAGIMIYNPRYYAGFSVLRLLPQTRYFYENTTMSFIPGNFYFLAGCNFKPKTGSLTYNPLLVFKMDQQMHQQIDVNLLVGFNEQFQGGLSYRQNIDKLPGRSTGMQFLLRMLIKKIQITYVAEVSLNQTQSSHFGSHELGLVYRICYREKPQCPAFE